MIRLFNYISDGLLLYLDSSEPEREIPVHSLRKSRYVQQNVPSSQFKIKRNPRVNDIPDLPDDQPERNARLPFSTKTVNFVNVTDVEECSDTGEMIVQTETGGTNINILLPLDFAIAPQRGDHLVLSPGGSFRDDGVFVPKKVEYARMKDGIFVRILQHHRTLIGQDFVLFEQAVCMAEADMPDNVPRLFGTLHKVSAVESRQPRGYSWRAWKVEKVTEEEREQLREILVTEEMDFGTVEFGSSVTKKVTVSNNDSTAHNLTRIALYGCHISRVHPLRISEPYFTSGSPGLDYPAIDFHPFKMVHFPIPTDSTSHVDVKLAGTIPGQWKFVLKLFFGKVIRVCVCTADVRHMDGVVCWEVVADPELRTAQETVRRTALREQADRCGTTSEARSRKGFVRAPTLKDSLKDEDSIFKIDAFRTAYEMPRKLKDLLVTLPQSETLCEAFPVLADALSYENYTAKTHLLLHLEEFEEELGMHRFDTLSDELERVEGYNGNIYKLKVSELTENRPSLMTGDFVVVNSVNDKEMPAHEGRIYEVEQTAVLIKFNPAFSSIFTEKKLLDFAFVINRNTYRRLHNTLEISKKALSQRFLFPSLANRDSCVERMKERLHGAQPMVWVNQDLNELQKKAVRMVTAGLCGPLAHIVFGPPGTGKTLTMVEIALQIYQRHPDAVILACAPSNSGTDLLGQRIIQSGRMPPTAVRRILGYSRKADSVPAELLPCVQIGWEHPLTAQHRLVLTTCQMATMFAEYPRSFTHVLIDEAGFATEPELLAPLSTAIGGPSMGSGVKVVLAGDPLQLGPVVMSPYAKTAGLEKSLLARLLELPAYSEWDASEFCPYLVSKLDVSYRSVESLLKIPSRLFYNAELSTAVAEDSNIYGPRLNIFPLTFWPVKSAEKRESRSPSVYNPGQITVVLKLFRHLLNVKMAVDDIGIITPYRLQAEHIRRIFTEHSLPLPKIGTVDEFQGQERDAIIFSTVRSCHCDPDQTDVSLRAVLGFVACPKRINVALTRARFVMMIVGDPFVLAMEEHWRRILRYCVAKNCYQHDALNDQPFPPPSCVTHKAGRVASREVPSDYGTGESTSSDESAQ